MTKPIKIDYIEMMDNFAQSLYDTVRPKSDTQPVVIEEMVSAFKELREWAVKRSDIINSDQTGGAIEQYQKGIRGRGNSIGKGDTDADTPTGILAQLGTRKRTKKPARLSTYIEGDGDDSDGTGTEQPIVPVDDSSVLDSLDGDRGSNLAEISNGGDV